MISPAYLEQLKVLYKLGINISLKDFQLGLKASKMRTYSPKEYLIEAGTKEQKIFFIRKGLVRSFQVNDKGQEITTQLMWENQFFASPNIILFELPPQYYVEALEPTQTISIDFELANQLIRQNPKLEETRKLLVRQHLKKVMERMHTFLLLTAEERYLKYIDQNPKIINRVPDKYIANVLGITPVSLSRIRGRIAARKK